MADVLRIGAVARAVGVSVETLRLWEAQGRVSFQRRANQRVLPVDQLAPLVASVSASRSSRPSNRLVGTVVGIRRNAVMTEVELVCGDYRVVSVLSTEVADNLEIHIGGVVAAVFPTHSVRIEL